jgi:hypothetical protein
LNSYEEFLNRQGCTLRQGPLALNKNSPDVKSTCCGVLYRLKKRKPVDERDLRKQIFFGTGIYERGERFRIYQEERGAAITQGRTTTKGRRLREMELPRGSASGPVRVLDASMPCVVPTPPLKQIPTPAADNADSKGDLMGAMKGSTKKVVDKATSLTHTSGDGNSSPGISTVNKAGISEGMKDEYAAACFYEPDPHEPPAKASAPVPRPLTATAFSTPAFVWRATLTAASLTTS